MLCLPGRSTMTPNTHSSSFSLLVHACQVYVPEFTQLAWLPLSFFLDGWFYVVGYERFFFY